MQPPWSWTDLEPSLLIGTLAACLSSSLLLCLWARAEGSTTSAPWTPRRLPHRLGTGDCVAGAQRRGPCCDWRPILSPSGHRTNLNLYWHITAVLSLCGCGRHYVQHPQWRGFVATAVPAIWKNNAPLAIDATMTMARHVLHRCGPRPPPLLLHLPPGLLLEEEPHNRRDQPIVRIMIGCDLLTQLAADPWQAARLNVLAHFRPP